MNLHGAWTVDPYFDQPSPESADGGMTSEGPLWHAISPRWGHSMHTMCSYHGMFPARLVHYFLQQYTREGGVVLDPFSGRGTTVLQSRVEGRRAIGGDLNPLAYVLTRAKASPPTWDQLMAYLSSMEAKYAAGSVSEEEIPSDIRMLFSASTLEQLVFLRRHLLSRPWGEWADEDFMVAACVAGALHGGHRADGSSAYLSISMPNTFSMSPEYVRRFIHENGLKPPDHNLFDVIRDKAARVYRDSLDGPEGTAHYADAVALLNSSQAVRGGTVDLVVTSPPYLRVVNYATSNWIRLWWLGIEDAGRDGGDGRLEMDARLDHRHTYDTYKSFMLTVFDGVARVLRRDGVAVFVIGDVAEPERPALELATAVWNDIGFASGLKLIRVIEDELQSNNKVSRIWGETRGQATMRDRILILGRADSHPRPSRGDISWDELYKDAGPDAAHNRLAKRRATAV